MKMKNPGPNRLATCKSRASKNFSIDHLAILLLTGLALGCGSVGCSSAPKKPDTIDDLIRREVGYHLNEHEACFEDYQKRRPNIYGDLALQWTIAPNGETTDVSVREDRSNLHDNELRRCMIESVKKVKFPAHPKGPIVVAMYPFRFRR